MRIAALIALAPLLAVGCNAPAGSVESGNSVAPSSGPQARAQRSFTVETVAQYDEPWAMTFLPDGNFLVTEKGGRLHFGRAFGREANGNMVFVSGVPEVDHGGQGGLGDVVIHPDFANNRLVYLSWVEAGPGDTRGAAVGRGRIVYDGSSARLEDFQTIWRQEPKVEGRGHFSHRMAFSPDGYLFITSGDRQKFTPAQDMDQNLGKVIRLTDAGGIPSDNPFYDQGRVRAQIWSLGHRNPLGIAFDPSGTLWTHEMGPLGGDEFNRIERGSNYGYPVVSDGQHYDGRDIPDHATRPEFNAPEFGWTPVISPSSLIFYSGGQFPQWRGSALIGALSGKALVRMEVDGTTAREVERWDMGERIREVEQGPDGFVYLIEDQTDGSGGRLLRLRPAR